MADLGNSAMDFIERRTKSFFKETLPVLIEDFLVDIPNLISKIITHFSQKLAKSFSSDPVYQKLISGGLAGLAESAILAPARALRGIKQIYDYILDKWEKIKVGVGWVSEKFNVIQNSSAFKKFISPLKDMLKIVEIISEKISKIKLPEDVIKALSIAGKFAGATTDPLGFAIGTALDSTPKTPARSVASGTFAPAAPASEQAYDQEQFVGPVQDSEPVISEQEKIGAEMLNKTSEEMGLTTVDNVEERLKKIKEIGIKISGSKKQFEEDMSKIREDLKSMNFSLFNNTADAAKFNESLGGLQQVLTFTSVIKSLVVSFQGVSDVIKGLGDSTVKGSIISNFIDAMGSFTAGMADVFVLFKGGKMSDGTTLDKGIRISDNSLANLKSFADGLNATSTAFGGVEKSLKSLSESFKDIVTNVASLQSVKKDMFNKVNDFSTDLIAGLSPLASLMGSINGDGISLNELFEAPADWTKAYDGVAEWGQNLYDFIEGTITQIDVLLPKADQLLQKVNELNAKIIDSFAQSAGKDIKIDVGEVGGEIKVKNPSIDMKLSPNINLQLKVSVTMDARELEKVLVTPNNSIIVTTFNEMSKQGPGATATGIQNQTIQVTKGTPG
jgi:uncharacterized protein YoxC